MPSNKTSPNKITMKKKSIAGEKNSERQETTEGGPNAHRATRSETPLIHCNVEERVSEFFFLPFSPIPD